MIVKSKQLISLGYTCHLIKHSIFPAVRTAVHITCKERLMLSLSLTALSWLSSGISWQPLSLSFTFCPIGPVHHPQTPTWPRTSTSPGGKHVGLIHWQKQVEQSSSCSFVWCSFRPGFWDTPRNSGKPPSGPSPFLPLRHSKAACSIQWALDSTNFSSQFHKLCCQLPLSHCCLFTRLGRVHSSGLRIKENIHKISQLFFPLWRCDSNFSLCTQTAAVRIQTFLTEKRGTQPGVGLS